MPRAAVVDAIEARLAAEWTHCVVVPFNSTYETPTDDEGNPLPFLQVQYPVEETQHLTLSRVGPARDDGRILFRLQTAGGVGISTAQEWCDDLRDLFHMQEFDGVQCREASGPRWDDDADLGGYVRATVSVRYWHYFNSPE